MSIVVGQYGWLLYRKARILFINQLMTGVPQGGVLGALLCLPTPDETFVGISF
jgi:hypothetical protein